MMLLQFLMKVMLCKLLAQVNIFFLLSVQRQNIFIKLNIIYFNRIKCATTVTVVCCIAVNLVSRVLS